jgi:hypothetical protein
MKLILVTCVTCGSTVRIDGSQQARNYTGRWSIRLLVVVFCQKEELQAEVAVNTHSREISLQAAVDENGSGIPLFAVAA